MNVKVPEKATIFMEAASLYLVAFRGRSDIIVLDGGEQENYMSYFPSKTFGKDVVKSTIPARYDASTWGLVFNKATLSEASNLPSFYAQENREQVKSAIDRLAFAISEAARFIPIRCAVACELADDKVFREVVARLAKWTGKMVLADGERTISKNKKLEDLSPADARLRRNLGEIGMKVFAINQNAFQNLTSAEKWLALLGSDGPLDDTGNRRIASLKISSSQPVTLKLGDFRALMTNWEKFSAIAHGDINFSGLVSEFHHRYTVGSAPAESLTLAEYH